MKDFNLAGLAGQRKPRVVPVIVHRFDGLVEWQDASIRQFLETILFKCEYISFSFNLLCMLTASLSRW